MQLAVRLAACCTTWTCCMFTAQRVYKYTTLYYIMSVDAVGWLRGGSLWRTAGNGLESAEWLDDWVSDSAVWLHQLKETPRDALSACFRACRN